jgi:NAD(P)H-hydrate epimerase
MANERFVTKDEMAAIEARSKIPVVTLMERAGRGVAAELRKLGFAAERIVFVCGPGNNGGDGYAAASFLPGSRVWPVTEPKTAAALAFYNKVIESPERVVSGVEGADCVVDCLLGPGVAGPVREPVASAIRSINSRKGKSLIVSVDVPSGLGTELQVDSDLVLAIGLPKAGAEGLKTIVVDVGLSGV